MKEIKETTFVVETTRQRDNKTTSVQRECFNFETLGEAQEFVDKCLEEGRFGQVDLFREAHSRRLLASSTL